MKSSLDDALIMGEVDGFKPEEFDLSNSPAEIMKANPGFHLIQVAYYPNLPGDINYCTTMKAKRLWQRRIRMFRHRITVFAMESHKAAEYVDDGTLDFVFIDADHSYEHCIEDIRDWEPKVKPGGLVCGHDIGHPDFPGVEKAVREHFGDDFSVLDHDWIWYTWKK